MPPMPPPMPPIMPPPIWPKQGQGDEGQGDDDRASHPLRIIGTPSRCRTRGEDVGLQAITHRPSRAMQGTNRSLADQQEATAFRPARTVGTTTSTAPGRTSMVQGVDRRARRPRRGRRRAGSAPAPLASISTRRILRRWMIPGPVQVQPPDDQPEVMQAPGTRPGSRKIDQVEPAVVALGRGGERQAQGVSREVEDERRRPDQGLVAAVDPLRPSDRQGREPVAEARPQDRLDVGRPMGRPGQSRPAEPGSMVARDDVGVEAEPRHQGEPSGR